MKKLVIIGLLLTFSFTSASAYGWETSSGNYTDRLEKVEKKMKDMEIAETCRQNEEYYKDLVKDL